MVQFPPESPNTLPMAGERRERGDAAANRERILRAARELVTASGPEALTMTAVASAAGVGKGTVFRRFGDRDGLTQALLDEHLRDFQESFLHGPPPLGPGAPPAERLEAFVVDLVARQHDYLDIALAAETRPSQPQPAGYGSLLIHVATLVHALAPDADERLLAGFILSAVAPPVLHRARTQLDVDTPALQAAARALLRGLTHPA